VEPTLPVPMAATSNPATAPPDSTPACTRTAVSQSAVTWPGSEISAGTDIHTASL
jgi:hypothetical protein